MNDQSNSGGRGQDSIDRGKLEIVIVDSVSGRGLGGHFENYLEVLKSALDGYELNVMAPFCDCRKPPSGRLGMYWFELRLYRRALRLRTRSTRHRIVIVHSAEYSDYVCCWAASRTLSKRKRATCLFMLRRGPTVDSLASESGRLGTSLIKLIVKMIERRLIFPVSDSRPALEQWTALVAGSSGALIEMPPLHGQLELHKADAVSALGERLGRRSAGPLVVVAGRMRVEKGAANYPAVVSATLAELSGATVALQVVCDEPAERAIVEDLHDEHDGDEHVILIGEHLSSEEYLDLLQAADVVVLPYATAGYGSGTSGVMSEALALGATVAVSRIEWATDLFDGDSRVAWIEDPASEAALRKAIAQAAAQTNEAAGAEDPLAGFRNSWIAAIAAALRQSE